ncbi:1-aminocyclopropane-1-carboxylate oxidase homolog 1-like [Papaver somniferum]|uniref:1-aminocyclopropane-1-carboxylate oxidase homolog 1-like n=1 Tax=Papaver somniferum TaxID=3469 RepID=UPI000E6FF306|nr:1-aminocyclopropane-1-carboxylate oxidase homolog 1-like [Papaver somniferum]
MSEPKELLKSTFEVVNSRKIRTRRRFPRQYKEPVVYRVSNREKCHYDRNKELKAFDETKTGVKGIVDLGIEKIPQMLVRTQDEFTEDLAYTDATRDQFQTPVIDLQGIDYRRSEIIDEIRRASMTWGFFQLVNHEIPVSVTNEMIEGIRRFHEGDIEVKKRLYVKEMMSQKVQYYSNYDLNESRSANWRDTFRCRLLNPDPIDPQLLPETCRDIIVEYWKHIMSLGDILAELFSEALGLHKDHLKCMDCTQYLGHYYPPCPEPELTMGSTKHADQSFFTILLQDQVAGLQFLHQITGLLSNPSLEP